MPSREFAHARLLHSAGLTLYDNLELQAMRVTLRPAAFGQRGDQQRIVAPPERRASSGFGDNPFNRCRLCAT